MTSILTGDATLESAVLAELAWDASLDAREISVEMDDGRVSLSGYVWSYPQKLAAERAAWRVSGVTSVLDEVVVKVPWENARTDDVIAHTVKRVLQWDGVLAPHPISFGVSNGSVTLEGSVDRLAVREEAERLVGRLLGVVGVKNRIVVRPSGASDAEIEQGIVRTWDRRRIPREGVKVRVSQARVTVSGSVKGRALRRDLIEAAAQARGAVEVVDSLVILPES
jgi:osmotically-inducible protein OsmY